MQFTTIRGIYIPRVLLSSGRYAPRSICTKVTKLATITMKAGILTLSGITFLSIDIRRFDIASTAVVQSPIDMPFMAEVVMASVGHIPSMSTKVGFSFTTPFTILSTHLFIIILRSLIQRLFLHLLN